MASVLTKWLASAACILVLTTFVAIFFIFYEQPAAPSEQSASDESATHNPSPPTVEFRHHSNREVRSLLASYAEYYPNVARKYSIGQSVLGNDLVALEISDNPGIHEPGEPELKLVGNIHGNEVVGRELLLFLIDYLLKNYQTDHTIQSLVDRVRLHIVPSLNPDGYDAAIEGDCDGVKGRENANNVDLNRNFPDQFVEGSVLEPETQSVVNWTLSYPFVLSAALHGGALVVNFPYDNNERSINQYTASPDDSVFRHIALLYSQNNADMKKGKCSDRCNPDDEFFEDGITNGAAWYPISGGMQDWNYLKANCFELTIELGCRKFPRPEELARYWATNIDSIIRLINAVHLGVSGFVVDQLGRPIEGTTISVLGVSKNVSSFKNGDYWRLLTPNAKYTLTASKEGYRVDSRTVSLEQSYQLNFTLHILS